MGDAGLRTLWGFLVNALMEFRSDVKRLIRKNGLLDQMTPSQVTVVETVFVGAAPISFSFSLRWIEG